MGNASNAAKYAETRVPESFGEVSVVAARAGRNGRPAARIGMRQSPSVSVMVEPRNLLTPWFALPPRFARAASRGSAYSARDYDRAV